MRVPLSWLREYVDIEIAPEELARRLTLAGLEVEAIEYVGPPLPSERVGIEARVSGLEWDREKIVVGRVLEVRPHPNADRLVLAELDDGERVRPVVTGAANLEPYKGKGTLERPLKVACAKEGARLYDGYKSGRQVTTLRRAKIRGIESDAMACSEKELGISDEHEGIILFDDDAPEPGTALADYIGDVVLDIAITPNMARNASILGVAREVAALTGARLHELPQEVRMEGPPAAEKVRLEIREPELNPRFTATILEGATIAPSPYWLQLRLTLAGMRPINNVVDVTNYVMLELGQPLHAFDYDELMRRAQASGAELPTIITRLPEAGERLTTLDDVERELDDFTILVADTAGALSLGGIMGGQESEVSDATTNVLLESAGWNFINIRRSVQSQQLQTSEAGYRFSRGVHPALAERGNRRGIELMRRLAGGIVGQGVVDEYPAPPEEVTVELPLSEVERCLGIPIPQREVVRILGALEFGVEERKEALRVTVPDHRLDIGRGVVGIADLIEEIARIWGYEGIPETQISDTTPPQRGDPSLEAEERVRDALVNLGLQEVVTYRLTTPEREAAALAPGSPADERPYVTLANPIASERTSLRHALLPSVLEIAESNARFRDRLALFEVGPVFLLQEGELLPDEPRRLAIVMSGPRELEAWQGAETGDMDFFDLKGVVEALLADLHLPDARFEPGGHPSLHPGRRARLVVGAQAVGAFGELHPRVGMAYGLSERPVLAAEFDLEAILDALPAQHRTESVSRFPAVVEDLALVVDESVPAARVQAVIEEAGGQEL
ncbi:MAG: phenylalanine--tRNA ligase subunit beta, partial [Thermoanaerobaculia bacterium]